MVSLKPAVFPKLNEEQLNALNSKGDVKIQAFAGTGKTTFNLAYALNNPGQHIIYTCFNRLNKIIFEERARSLDIEVGRKLQIETAHSLAKRAIFPSSDVKLIGAHSLMQLREYLKVEISSIDEDDQYVILYHVMKLVVAYCNSIEKRIEHFDYLNTLDIGKRRTPEMRYETIVGLAKTLMLKMHQRQIPVIHDYYLKLFHVKSPKLVCDAILFDEVQDASPVMIDIVLNQKCRKIFCGDTHQSIYAWRGAQNTMDLLSFPQLPLTESFRFGQNTADFANHVLSWKKAFVSIPSLYIKGSGPNSSIEGTAIISRTIVGLIKMGIEKMIEEKEARFFFHGGINQYFRHEQDISIHDIYHLYFDYRYQIRNETIKSFEDFEDFERFVREVDDNILAGFIQLVKRYEKRLISLLKALESRSVPATERNANDYVMTTVHRAKGLEFREVYLTEDFMSFDDLYRASKSNMSIDKIIEEINIFYVAVTRSAGDLNVPERYLTHYQ